jgi:hypothetical protein
MSDSSVTAEFIGGPRDGEVQAFPFCVPWEYDVPLYQGPPLFWRPLVPGAFVHPPKLRVARYVLRGERELVYAGEAER